MSGYLDDKAEWLELEQMAVMTPAADHACRKCGRGTASPLCVQCESDRRGMLRRFGGRAGSNRPARKTFTADRPEYLPYKDAEERR